MKYQKINSKTWVLGKYQHTPKPDALLEEPKPEKRTRNANNAKAYRTFCRSVFENRSFICIKEFNKLISQHFNQNATYYRNRMLALGLIKIEHKIVKLNKK